MVIWSNAIVEVLSRIYLEGIALNGEIPDVYAEAKFVLSRLDTSIVNTYAISKSVCPVGWKRCNYLIATAGRGHNTLIFSYTKTKLMDGEILIIVEEVADAFGNILTENKRNNFTKNINTMKNKKVIRLTESDLHNVIKESVQQVLMEMTQGHMLVQQQREEPKVLITLPMN